jgi:hypothetical protein
LKLAGNDNQKALLAGLLSFKDETDALISIDADLQDDVRVIEEMIVKFIAGIDVVYGVRRERTTDTFFKKNTALLFYKLMLDESRYCIQPRRLPIVQQARSRWFV